MLRLDEIIGLEVLTSDAKLLGNVEGVAVDTQDWHARALRITLKKGNEENVGVRKPLFGAARIAIDVSKVSSVRDVIKLRESILKLKELLIDIDAVPFSAGDIINRRVVCAKGREIGITSSLYFDPEGGWRIPFFEVEMYRDAFKEMDLKKAKLKRREVKIPTSLISTVGDLIILNTSEEELRRILELTPK
ncbi:MAG: PRC-barrel domain-containing protein [Methanomassiliicoccales archaeon]